MEVSLFCHIRQSSVRKRTRCYHSVAMQAQKRAIFIPCPEESTITATSRMGNAFDRYIRLCLSVILLVNRLEPNEIVACPLNSVGLLGRF